MTRYLKYDVLRIFSIGMVLMLHASAHIVILLEGVGCSANPAYIAANLLNGLGRFAVPVFVMLSGALLLNENKRFDAKTFYRKSLLWMFLIFLFWLVVYGVFYARLLPYNTDFISFELNFKGSSCPHLWYLYFVLVFYLSVPLLRLYVKKENARAIGFTILICLGLALLGTLCNLITQLTGITVYVGTYHIEKFSNFLALILAGWYLANHGLSRGWKALVYILGAASCVAIVGLVWFQYEIIGAGVLRDYVSEAYTVPAALFGIAVFQGVCSICGGRATKNSCVKACSELSFGVYLLHIFFFECFTCYLRPYDAARDNALLYILALWAFMLVLSLLAAFALSRIRYLKKLIYIK